MRSLGYLRDPEDLAAAYGAADVFVAPSLEESFGQVFVEAAACGTPAVGYPVMGVKNALRDGITGRLAAAVTPGGPGRCHPRAGDPAGSPRRHGRLGAPLRRE